MARRFAIGAVIVAACAGLASAQTIEAERAALQRAKTQAVSATQRASAFEARAGAARDAEVRARAEAAALAARIQSSEADIAAAEARVAIIEELRRVQRARLADKQGPAIRLVAAIQTMARRPPALGLVQPGSTADLVHVRATLAALIPELRARTAGLRADLAKSRELRAQAGRAVRALADGRQLLVAQRAQLSQFAVRQRAASARFASSAMLEQDRALALAEDARDITDLMGRLDAMAGQRRRLESLPGPVPRPARPGEARAAPRDVTAAETRIPRYRLPVVGEVTEGFGEVSGAGVRSRGLTVATQPNALVVAPTSGRIAFAGPYRGFGLIVIVDHGNGWTSLITGLAALDVRAGDTVDQGSPMGRAGAGRPAVTVELRRGGEPVDIVPMLG